MEKEIKTKQQLFDEIEGLRIRLKEAEETLSAVRNGEVDAILVSGPQGEQVFTLTGTERVFRVLIETMNEGAASLNQEGLIIYCNQRFAEMIKTPLEKVIGSTMRQFIRASDIPVFDTLIERKAEESGKGEVALINNDGTVLPVLLSISAIQLDKANISNIIVTDLTAQKRIEEELRRHRDNLEKRVNDRTHELETSNQQLREEITDRKKAEETLRVSQQLIEGIIDAIPVRVFWKDKNLVYLGCNAAFARDAGFADPKDIIGKDDYQMGWRAQAELYRNDDRQVLEHGVTKHLIEEPQTTPAGDTITLLTSKLSLRNSKGEISGILGIYIDITARKKTEEALRESSEFNRQIIESAQEGLIVYGPDLKFQVWNPFMERITGIAASEVLGRHPLEVFPFLRESGVVLGIEKAMRGETIRSEPFPFHVPKSGLSGWASDISAPLRNLRGDIIGVIGTVRDITENMRAEEALKEEKRFVENALNTLQDIFFVFDLEGRFLRWNKTFNAVTGYIDAEIALMKPADLFRNDDIRRIAEAIRTAEKSGGVSVEALLVTKDGRQIPYEFGASQLVDQAGNLIGISGVGRDLAERHKLEAQLRHAQKLEGIGTLAGGIAHDFNNILSAIVGYGYVTLMKMPKDDPLRMNIENILESTDRAATLTQSLLVFSRKQITNRKPVDLNNILSKVEKFLVRVIGEDVVVRLALVEGALTIFADAGQLEQVFMNLATNARDAMPNGGFFAIETSIIELDSGFVSSHGYGKEGTFAMISATDNGIGMTEETRLKIFEPFFTTKEVGKGTGLGLAMVYGILKQHEGFINVYSEPGKGTTFRIYLPLIKAEAVEVQRTIAAEYPKGGTETVLLAEDDASLRKISMIVLEQMGYTVITANDGEEAVTKFMENKDRIQLLLFDIIMPKKNGRDAYAEIRRVMPNIPVLFTSGYSPDMLNDKALIEKGAAIVYKPISPMDLSKKVREVLDRK